MDELLDTGQAATALGLSVRRVQRLAQEGRLAPFRYVRGSPIFTRKAVDTFRAIPRKPGRPRKPKED